MNYGRWVGALLFPVLLSHALSAGAGSMGLNFISKLEGTVEVKRSSWKAFQRAFPGDSLNAGDLIRVAKGGRATVVCGNLTMPVVPVGKAILLEALCKGGGRTVLYRPDQKTAPTRSGVDMSLPYLLSPRNTGLLGRQPILRWHDIHAAPYTVMVTGGKVDWSVTVNEAQVVFPGEMQPIEPGYRYRVTVVAGNGVRTAEDDPVRFSFLSNEQVRQIQEDVRRVRQLHLLPEAEVLALGVLYQSYGLRAEAIDLLTKAQESTATLLLLGEVYLQSGLLELARARFSGALKLAKGQGSLEGQAVSLVRLGQVEQSLGLLRDALLGVQEAKAKYEMLGDQSRTKELEKVVNYLAKRVRIQ